MSGHDDPRRNETGSVLIVDDHRNARESMAEVLRMAGHAATPCSSAAEAIRVLSRESFDCVVTDLKMPGMSGLEFIAEIDPPRTGAQVVMVTAHASVATAVEAMRLGAFDYIEKPFDADQLERLVGKAVCHRRLLRGEAKPGDAAQDDPAQNGAASMIGSGRAMRRLHERIALVGPTDETILVTGESGVGKELVARAIHAAGRRAAGPFVGLNCPVLSAQLMESELFGHEKGAFTGADGPRVGRFEMADRGTILLDEVTEIDPPLQAKLLRVLQEKSFERVGSSETRRVDVRVIATTNRDLWEEVEAGRFRKDLYYRLAVVPIDVPPLRERREDIPELASHFAKRTAARLERRPFAFTQSALEILQAHDWPGNVREFENFITRVGVLGEEDEIDADAIRRWLGAEVKVESEPSPPVAVGMSLQETERCLIEATLEHFAGHREKTAEALGIGVRTLSSKLRQYGYKPRASFRKSA